MRFQHTALRSGGRLLLPSPDTPTQQPLAGQLVVFTGKLSSLGRRDAHALVTRLGGATAGEVSARTTLLVVGAEGFGAAFEGDRSHKLRRAEALRTEIAPNIRIVTEEEFCRLAGVPTAAALRRQYYRLRDLLGRYQALSEDHVRYLIKWGIIRPVLRRNADTYFAFQDLAAVKQANDQLEQGRSFPSVVRSLAASREGQLALDFRLNAAPARIITLERHAAERQASGQEGKPARRLPRDNQLAEEYFRAAALLDTGDEAMMEQAAAAYRKALELDPYMVAALINLANIHYSRDELVEAQAIYERAIGLESDFFEAHFNLGNIYHDLGRYPEAQACYREAVRLNPGYADAHFYLAVTFEKMGLSSQARPYWRAYQQLAPDGEWVELAKEFSD